MKSEQIVATLLKQVQERIKSKEFLDEHWVGNAFTRSGKLSFGSLVYYTLQATHKSNFINYAQLREFLSERLPFVSKQAISKARQRISHKAFEVLFRDCIEVYHRNFKDFRLWNGFHIYAVDGSTIQIPESQENIEVFGGNPNKTDKLTPLASVSTLYDIMNDMILEITFNPYRYNERTAAKEHMEFMPNHPTTIVLFDRGYPSEELFRYLDSKRMFFLMRIPKTFKKLIFSAECCTFYISSKPFEIRTDIKVHSFYFRRWNKRAFGNKCTAGAA